MKYLQLLFKSIHILILAGFVFSCDSDEGLEIKSISDFDIYASDTVNNAMAFDMVRTTRGFLITSITGTSRLANKFDGDGRLSLLEVDNFGNILWEDLSQRRLFESGYPSNLIITNNPDQFLLLWNEFNGGLKSIPLSVGISPDSLSIQKLNCDGCRADNALSSNGFIYVLGLSEKSTGPTTVITEFNPTLNSSRSMTEKSFDASRLGGFGLTDLNFVNRINNFLHLKLNGLRFLYTGPSNSSMILSHVGELIPEYSNNNLWIADMVNNPDHNESFALILQNPFNQQGQSIFIPDVDLSGLPGKSMISTKITDSMFRFSSLDPNLPQFIINYDPRRWVLIGTSLNGLPTLISINTETNEIIRSDLGDNSRLNIAKVQLFNSELYISGTTVVNNRFQRPFLLRIAQHDIF